MQSVMSRIWTRVAVSISYDDYHYTTGIIIIIIIKVMHQKKYLKFCLKPRYDINAMYCTALI